MKNKLLIIFLSIILLVPICVKADNINTSSIVGPTTAKVGEEFTLSLNISFKDVYKDNKDSLGVYGILAELDFDDKDFTITGLTTSDAFESEILKTEDGKYFLVSLLSENYNASSCYDKILFCGIYTANITFYTNQTTKKESVIKIGNYEGYLLKMIEDLEKEITTDDLKIYTGTGDSEAIHSIKISQSNIKVSKKDSIAENSNKNSSNTKNEIKKETQSNINEKTNSSTNKDDKEDKETSSTPSADDNHLKSLKIKGYELDFDKYKKLYTLKVESDVNKLEITANAQNSKSKVKITGADDLKKNNDKVTIEVTSQTKETRTYVITIDRLENVKHEQKKNNFKLTDEQIKIGVIILIAIGILAVGIFIAIKIRDKVIEKDFDKL